MPDYSVNEINGFKRCPRNWDITSANRQSLHARGMPAPAFHVGSAVHFALAAHGLGADPVAATLVFFQQSTDTLAEHYKQVIGTGLDRTEWATLREQRDQVVQMVEAYVARYGTKRPFRPYKLLAAEVTFRIPLVPEQDINLVGTLDRALVDEYGNVGPGEIKTYKSKPKKEGWRFNHQLYGYACALQVLTGLTVSWALYDGVRKKAPSIPRVLKDGTVTRAWLDTTYDVYRAKLLEVYGGDKAILSHPAYAPLLSRYWARDHSPESAFHTRFRIPISQYALENWWRRAQRVTTIMANDPDIYPVFDWQGCPLCKVRNLCHTIEANEDVTWLLENEYIKGLTHTRQATRIATPDDIKSLSDLAAFSGKLDPDRPFDPSFETSGDIS